MGEPVFSATSFAHYMLMKEIRKNGVKVVLNGQGSDEAWCGYGRYIIGYFLVDQLFTNPARFVSQLNKISGKMLLSYKLILSQTLKAMMSRKTASRFRSKYVENTKEVLSPTFIKYNSDYFSNSTYKRFSGTSLDNYTKFNIQYQGFGQILHYEDHSSMQSSIEMRSPFIDYRIIELAFSTPVSKKFDNGITKKVLREIYSNKLPDSIINNHKKIGFVTPFNDWLNDSNLKNFLHDLISSDSLRSKKIFSPGKIERVYSNREKYPGFPFWRFINLELWSRAYGITNL